MTAAQSFGRDRRGSIGIITAFGVTGLLGLAALGIDLAVLYKAKRQAQGSVDVAAMLAAADLTQADAIARRALSENGFGLGTTIVVARGRYVADPNQSTDARFVAGAAPHNAVRVTLRASIPTHFTRLIGLPSVYALGASGTAAKAEFAAFSIGSGLASLDGGIANAVLGALIGAKLSLTVMDYDALVTGRVDAFRFLDALATEIGLEAASYTKIVDAEARLGQIVAAMRASGSSAAAASALGRLAASAGRSSTSLRVSDLVDLGDAVALSPERGMAGPSLALMDTLSRAIVLANGERQVAIDLGPSVPGLTDTRLTLTIGERRQRADWTEVRGPRPTVETAQMRLLVEARLTAPLGLGTLAVPLYVEAAYAKATLRSVTCPWRRAGNRQVAIDAQPGLLDLAIAQVPPSAVVIGGPTPDLSQPATLLALPLLTIKGRARATLESGHSQTLSFSDADIAASLSRGVSSGALTHSLTGSLLGSISLSIAGLDLLALPTLRPLLTASLSALAAPLDAVLDNTLRTLGIRVGYAEVTVDGVRCDHAVLVQ